MKKIYSILLSLSFLLTISAADFTGVKVYINPGHGGYNANDRNLITINYELGDTLGFYESYSNLQKGLALRDMLQASNATVYMSRTLNREVDDRPISEIAEEANANNVDAFLSIHSNAIASNTGINYLLLLFHGRDNNPKIPLSLTQCNAAWPRLISNKLTIWTSYTTSTNIRGDSTFYGTYGLGVLKPLTVPGFLSEGSFHDYQPETHRLMNNDYRKLEATNFYRYFCDYFSATLPSSGIIAGWAKGKDETISHPRFNYKTGTTDRWLPLNGAKVKLMNASGDSLNGYQVDSLYNGIFAFHNLTPGTYKLRIVAKDHTTKDTTVTVTGATTTFAKMLLVNENIIIPKDTTPDYPEPLQEAGIAAISNYKFGTSTPIVPEWLNQTQIKKVVYRNEKLYILTTEPKIIIANAVTFSKIREMDLTGITGGMNLLNDIAFTADDYLVACNKDTVSLPELKSRYFKVYTWDNDSVAPKLLFQSQSQGNWTNGIIGETFAVSGSRWKCTVYTTSVTSSPSKQIRVVGLLYEEGIPAIGYKYMINASYTESLWGKTTKFTISPTGKDHFFLDSEILLPTEFQFDWSKPDRESLVNKGVFTEKAGYTMQPKASGIHLFRHAKNVFMTSPVCNADSTAVGVALFDITSGISNAVKVSQKLPQAGLGSQKSTYMAAFGKVNGYDIDLIILAQNEGIARYRTATTTIANIYASELKLAVPTCICPNTYQFGFILNENATNVDIKIMQGENVVKVIPGGALLKGQNAVTGVIDGVNPGEYTWSVAVTTESLDRPVKISDNANGFMQFNYPRAVSVDNSFNSPFFGRIYVSESAAGTLPARTTQDGIYILNAAFQDITGQGVTAYNGAVSWGTTSNSSPMRMTVGEDSKVYVCDWSDAHPGVWVMDPASPSSAFKPVFEGLTKSTNGLSTFNSVNIHGSISHCYAMGTGNDTRLYTFDEDYVNETATNAGNLLQYNIGTLATPHQSAPTVIYNDILNGNLQQNFNSCIAPDTRGGWWISQYRAADAALIPALIHVNTSGIVDFNSGNTPTLIENSYHGGMAVNADGTKLAMGCSNEVKIFKVTFSEAGIPALTKLHSIKPALGVNTAGLSFDRAGNVYAVSFSDKRLGVWALPKADNSFTTPAPSAQKILVEISDIDAVKNPTELVDVFPNPAIDYINIESKGIEIETYHLYNLKGQLIANDQITNNRTQISLNKLQSGVYILKVKTIAGIAIKRILKK